MPQVKKKQGHHLDQSQEATKGRLGISERLQKRLAIFVLTLCGFVPYAMPCNAQEKKDELIDGIREPLAQEYTFEYTEQAQAGRLR